MILVDTSIWIDHLHRTDAHLSALLVRGLVLGHPLVIEELALGSLTDRQNVLTLMSSLGQAPTMRHNEFLEFVDRASIAGRGIGVVDAHLLGSVRLSKSRLWTRDKRLRAAADELGIGYAHN